MTHKGLKKIEKYLKIENIPRKVNPKKIVFNKITFLAFHIWNFW